MLLEVNEKTYYVEFRHYFGNYFPKPSTGCNILDVDTKVCLASGFAFLSQKDKVKYNKSFGKKLALSRALHNLYPDPFTNKRQDIVRSLRAEFWKSYFYEIGKNSIADSIVS